MEGCLTLDELYLLIGETNAGEYSRRRFAAALKGIDMEDEEEEVSTFDQIRQQADDILGQKTEEFENSDPFGLDDDDD